MTKEKEKQMRSAYNYTIQAKYESIIDLVAKWIEENKDPYTELAIWLNIPRKEAKTLLFPMLYGQGDI